MNESKPPTDPTTPRRLLIANLHFETCLATQTDAATGVRELSPLALRTSAALGTLMRVFARDDDLLWLPAEVAATRLDGPSWLARPRLVTGPLEALPLTGEILTWGETEDITALRSPPAAEVDSDSLVDRLWRSHPPASAARAANDRGFALRCARELGVALPGATLVRSLTEIEACTAALASSREPRRDGEPSWVLKAPFSAAGRDRVLGSGGSLARAERRQADTLLERFGELVFEPWLERTADLGCSALVGTSDAGAPDTQHPRVISTHRQLVDGRGRIRGIEVTRDSTRPDDLPWLDVIRKIGSRLRDIDYTGPFGVDAWRWRDAGGAEHLHPLGEVNARLSFGLIARVLLDRWLDHEPSSRARGLRLLMGPESPASSESVRLLAPAADDRAGAWLEPLFA